MSFRKKPQRANSFSLSSPLTSFNKVLTLTRHSSSADVSGDFDTRSDIVSNNNFGHSFRRLSSQAYTRVRKSVTNSSSPSGRSKAAPHMFDKPLSRPTNRLEGVIVFSSANNGFCCNLLFTPTSIVFERNFTNNKNPETEKVIPDVPPRAKLKARGKGGFEESMDGIDLLNIGSVQIQKAISTATIWFEMRNFKVLKVQISSSPVMKPETDMRGNTLNKSSTLSRGMNSPAMIKSELDKICQYFEDVCQLNMWRERGRPMILEKDLQSKSFLWEHLYTKYPFTKRTDFVDFDWAEREHIINYAPIQDSHLSQTLPPLIPVLPNKRQCDLEAVGHYSADQRIPFVCYVHPATRKLLIRSTHFHLTDQAIDFVRESVSRSVDVREEITKHLDIYGSYEKLRKSVIHAVTNSQNNKESNYSLWSIDKSKKFWSKCNGWLAAVSRALSHSRDISNELKHNQSIALFEPFDCEWNCVISSLVQVLLEPSCRTMEGFEKLISKEWLFFSGFKRDKKGDRKEDQKYIVRIPSSVMFNLFLDCVHQLIAQNSRAFEFSTSYLILLWDSCFKSLSSERDCEEEFSSSKAQPEMQNVLYEGSGELIVDAHITSIRLFNALFFRQVRIDHFHFALPETIQKEQLKKFL